ncbi:heavy metal translocating P-type ATPase [Gordonia bronchialis DSM 43247]|uniref:Cation-transporting P-type ATPase B n=1 Tax=Gordonia bronchialis (strain ATCC 25592 / DSM 43247 / BCRC 13721 / JCM 3198 / KCTC 3076 / NBRC 16047 / NCTC 10667) TaxID=526226 RepID=D0LEX5_GORB4|nr:heavy metal translocating P-type ATPase [Gordonia bronchialis]ACY21849.1 heavy metal translocating P-type ATPase [Gordonia bronchialis DSM 43247]MCC3324635.1 heavy metal translocating P-type ATPase [Gordonia bronchialis]STQ64743.1 Copper-exporting P-type ATPase A [Gordonia bronchialis]
MTQTIDCADRRVRQIQLDIEGMTCGACANRIERKLNKIDGVRASVNYATHRATIDIGSDIDVGEAISTVDRAGYTATPHVPHLSRIDPDTAHAEGLLRRLIIAVVLFIPLADVSVVLSVIPELRFPGWQILLIVLAAPIVTYCAWPFYRTALRTGAATMETLVSIGVLAASGLSLYSMFATPSTAPTEPGVWAAIAASDSIYLEVAAGVTVFVLAGRYFEARARARAAESMRSLAALRATDAHILLADGTEMSLPTEELKVGHTVIVRSGQTIPTDGDVVDGRASVDASMMTGENAPIVAEPGARSAVVGGTVCLEGTLVVSATAVGDDTRLAEMIRLVDQAQLTKARAQRVADRVATLFVPAVVALSAVTAAAWLSTGGSLEHALSAAVAVLVIACPCALGLATPMALMVAAGRGAQLGIFLKGHQALELSGRIDTVLLDKTGTITTGVPCIHDIVVSTDISAREALRLAASLEQHSEHPIARALTSAAQDTPLEDCLEFSAEVGRGVRGIINGTEVSLGSPTWVTDRATVSEELVRSYRDFERAGHTAVCLAIGQVAVAVIAVTDEVKPSAHTAVTALRRRGVRTLLVTGDNHGAAHAVADEVGITEVVAEVLPAAKADIVNTLRRGGACVAMVGDGINDGPALATADLGVAMGRGTDIAIGAADIVLMRSNLLGVVQALDLARATQRTIRVNLVWAFGYNIAALPVAAAGLLNPLIAGAAMGLSSLFVVTNSLRLRRFGADRSTERRPARA